VVTAAAAATLIATLTGCAKMDAALSQQWMTVQFFPGTTVAAELQVRTACSHMQDTPPLALPAKRSVINMMYGVRFDTTNSSPAELAGLQTCLEQFKAVQSVDPESAADEGS